MRAIATTDFGAPATLVEVPVPWSCVGAAPADGARRGAAGGRTR